MAFRAQNIKYVEMRKSVLLRVNTTTISQIPRLLQILIDKLYSQPILAIFKVVRVKKNKYCMLLKQHLHT